MKDEISKTDREIAFNQHLKSTQGKKKQQQKKGVHKVFKCV